jgi:hypothetical protein
VLGRRRNISEIKQGLAGAVKWLVKQRTVSRDRCIIKLKVELTFREN